MDISMDIEKVIRAWKAEEDEWEVSELASPVGQELTEEELLAVSGSDCLVTVRVRIPVLSQAVMLPQAAMLQMFAGLHNAAP